jgi:metallophosphoesterase (TIGR03767 family)
VAAAIGAGSYRAATAATEAVSAATAVPLGVTSWDQTVKRTSYTAAGYQKLIAGGGEPHVARTDLANRQGENPPTLALAAFAQMTDLHIVDDQSPGRLEFMDRYADAGAPHFASYPTDSAYRPHEFLSTQVVDAMCQAIAGIGKGPWTGKSLLFTIVTGDAIDNCQHNENRWYIDLLDGGRTIVPTSGDTTLDQSIPSGALFPNPALLTHYYYPSITPGLLPGNRFSGAGGLGFPFVPGLLKPAGSAGAARRAFISHGLGMPWYSAYGNHDGMWQGNEPIDNNILDVNAMTIGAAKGIDTTQSLPDDYADLGALKKLRAAKNLLTVPVVADNTRRLLSRKEFIQDHFTTAGLPVGHGFQSSSTDKAYYAIPFASTDLVRYITLDSTNTNTDGLGTGGASGSLDDTQYEWLKQQLIANNSQWVDDNGNVATHSVQDKLYVLFFHHTLDTMDNLDDGTIAGTGDKRWTGDELEALLHRFPNVIAVVNGHTHANKITPHHGSGPLNSRFWEISTASHIDWPIQSRIIEIAASPNAHIPDEFGNIGTELGNISIFTTMVDPAAPLSPGTDLSNTSQLASLARELATNDPQEVVVKPGHNGIQQRMGTALDRNTQLVVGAPFDLFAPRQEASPIAVARNTDGRLELFGTDAAGNLWNTSQKTASGNLQAWTKLSSGPGWRSVTAAPHQDGRIELFALLTTHISRRTQTSPGSSTYVQSQGFDDFFTSVAATRDPWGGMNVYATHDDHTIWHRVQDVVNNDTLTPGWATPWDRLAGTAFQIAVETASDGHGVQVAITDTGQLIYRKMTVSNATSELNWGPMLQFDGPGRFRAVDMARNLDGRLVVFAVNTDGQLFHRFETAPGSGTWVPCWTPLPTKVGETTLRMRHIAAERSGPGRIELYAVDSTGMLYHTKQSNPNTASWPIWGALNFQLRASHSMTGL